MTEQEIRIRRQINQMGYKLKYNGNQYCIKRYSGGLVFKTLEQIENWISQVKEKEKKEREEYKQKVMESNDKVVFPIYTEDYKKAFFECIRENQSEITESQQELEKIFDKDNELYDFCFLGYDIESILSNIGQNRFCWDNLGSAVSSDMESLYCKEIKRSYPDIDEDIIGELPDYDFVGFYGDVLDHVQIEELKECIMSLADPA